MTYFSNLALWTRYQTHKTLHEMIKFPKELSLWYGSLFLYDQIDDKIV